MISATKKQKQIIAILTKGDKEQKKSLVQLYTGDIAKTSTNDLTHFQANQIIQRLGGKPIAYGNWAFFDKSNQQHRQILSLCIQYGWSNTSGKHSEVANLNRLDNWLRTDKRCPVAKPLKQMIPQELSKIIVALEGMIKWKYKTP